MRFWDGCWKTLQAWLQGKISLRSIFSWDLSSRGTELPGSNIDLSQSKFIVDSGDRIMLVNPYDRRIS